MRDCVYVVGMRRSVSTRGSSMTTWCAECGVRGVWYVGVICDCSVCVRLCVCGGCACVTG